jgi:hypothetical protein
MSESLAQMQLENRHERAFKVEKTGFPAVSTIFPWV